MFKWLEIIEKGISAIRKKNVSKFYSSLHIYCWHSESLLEFIHDAETSDNNFVHTRLVKELT